MQAKNEKTKLEVAHIFRFYSEYYRVKTNLPTRTRKIIENIEFCRTPLMGNHYLNCDHCSYKTGGVNSCKDRHCPKCQAMKKAQWLEDRKRDLLPVGYLHNVFTLPHELNTLILCNKEILLKVLFNSAAETLKQFALDPDWGLEGKLGFTSVLHTWDQKLNLHYHLHVIIAAGALSKEGKWVGAKKKKKNKEGFREDYLFSVHALSPVFRGKFLEALKNAYKNNELVFKGEAEMLSQERHFLPLVDSLYRKDWVLYSKRPFKGAEHVYEYLARYTHRIAISNDRLVSMDNGQVGFTFKDRNNNYQKQVETIPAELFIKRFLFHELPSGFQRIRHYGFLSSSQKKENLQKIRRQLKVPEESILTKKMTKIAIMRKIMGDNFSKCPECKEGELQYHKGMLRWEILSAMNPPRTWHEYSKLKQKSSNNSS